MEDDFKDVCGNLVAFFHLGMRDQGLTGSRRILLHAGRGNHPWALRCLLPEAR